MSGLMMPVNMPPMSGPPLQLPNMSHPPPNMPPPRFNMPPPMPMNQGPPGMPPQSQQQQRNYVQQMRQQMASQGIMFDGKRMRKAVHRKTVDYNSSVVKYLENRLYQRDHRDFRAIQPDCLYQEGLVPPLSLLHNSMNCVVTKFVRTSTNKFRCPIFVLTWTPEGRRLVTGASSGEFTLWNGLTFNFETILQAHDTSVRAMMWSHSDTWMVTADHSGYIKYWQSNMNNVKMFQGHKEPVRGIRYATWSPQLAWAGSSRNALTFICAIVGTVFHAPLNAFAVFIILMAKQQFIYLLLYYTISNFTMGIT